jgi:acyl-coenzyme A synthetase/AMP-(fatty) acid ligase/acyl carrier protein
MNTHGGLRNRLLWMQDAFQLTAADAVCQKTPYSFDVSVWEFFWPLMVGARLVVARPDGHRDSAYLAELFASQKITTVHFVPSMLAAFLGEPGLDRCVHLKRVICSGEALSFELAERFFARSQAELHNLYGPTEASIDVTFHQCRRGDARRMVPIGRPIANTQIYILDARGEPVPIGVTGELYIGGAGVGRGYLNRPALTAERFTANPFGAGRMYRTGDLARWLPDGEIEYLGRTDHQVKLRGFRIELGEIETVLRQHASVRDAVVVAREDAPGDQRLAAYLVLHEGQALDADALRGHAGDKLPGHMIPSSFTVLPAFPLTPSGKIDRRSLPAPDRARPERGYVAPRSPVEEALADIWKVVLGVDRVGAHDDFFALGGHSLLATEIAARVRVAFSVELPLKHIFAAPTLEALAKTIVSLKAEQVTGHELDDMLAKLEGLSEEEAAALLASDEVDEGGRR